MIRRAAAALAFASLLAGAAGAQRGDVSGEAQPPLRDEWRVPAPEPLSAEQELATFRVDSGLRVELVAAEPLVRDPVCATFDERGRLWVCEMSGYMRDADGAGESEPCGAVVVLSDADGDGRMDRRDVFLDGLVLPRAVAPARGGALVIAPPDLVFARDTDGDGRADERTVVDSGLQGIASPEHAINGLLYTLDDAYACANAPLRYRFVSGKWTRERTAGGGQWGIAEDRWGRIYTNDNSNPLRCDLFPSRVAARHPGALPAAGIGVSVAKGSRPRPSRLTPGVNRGYRAGVLDGGRLNEFTAACAPWIYEGDALPERYRGDALVCEPAGNLVHRFEIESDAGGRPRATSAAPDGAFLSSTDERFRPVGLTEGPDGALYVVDMYRGVIQHKLFVTSWLRAQIEERGLEQPLGRGRIWRVTAGDRAAAPDLAGCTWTELAARLGSANRWTRKTAQRLFVEEGDGSADAVEVLREALRRDGAADVARLHAACALVVLGGYDESLPQPGPFRVSARILARREVPAEWLAPPEPRGAWWDLLAAAENSAGFDWAEIWSRNGCEDEVARSVALSACAGGELELLDAVLAASSGTTPPGSGTLALFERIAACVVREGDPARLEGLLERVAAEGLDSAARRALAEGALSGRAKDAKGGSLPIRTARPAPGLEGLGRAGGEAAELAAAVIWPGKPGTDPSDWPRELDATERARFERGREVYEQSCAACHQASGAGDVALAPPLRGSPAVMGEPERLLRVVLHGLAGPVTRGGTTWSSAMPAFAANDADVAALATYVRRAWGHGADPIAPELVSDVRARHGSRAKPWSSAELGLE